MEVELRYGTCDSLLALLCTTLTSCTKVIILLHFLAAYVSASAQPSSSPTSGKKMTMEDLKFVLMKNLDAIVTKFASYVNFLRAEIVTMGISPEDLRLFLLSLSALDNSSKKEVMLTLMSDKKLELMKLETITGIFTFLITDCTSFLNYDIFQKIVENYNISTDHERMKYPEHLKNYIKKHNISEFSMVKPKYELKNGTEYIILKFNVKNTCKLAKVFDLKEYVANVLELNPSVLQIVDIEVGCILVTFSIPTSIAELLFSSNQVFTQQQKDKFTSESILWLKCNGFTFNFESHSGKNVMSIM